MAVIATLAAVTITGTEQSTVQAAVGNGVAYGDITGQITAWLDTLKQIKYDMTNFNAQMPSGTNKTNIASVISGLA